MSHYESQMSMTRLCISNNTAVNVNVCRGVVLASFPGSTHVEPGNKARVVLQFMALPAHTMALPAVQLLSSFEHSTSTHL